MKKIPFIIIFSVIIFSCKAQTRNSKENNGMQHFDINKFLENNPKGDEKIITKENGFKVRQMDYGEYYIEDITKLNSPEVHRKGYFKKTGRLCFESDRFDSFSYGIEKTYNENGELIKEVFYDKDYKFSIDDLQKKMKEVYNVDIMDKKQTRLVNRTAVDTRLKFPYYQVLVNSGIASFTDYLLNGNTGEIIYISKTIRDYEKDTVDEYIKSLKK